MIQTVGVIGAGTMGSGIAQAFAAGGYAVRLVDTDRQALSRAQAVITTSLAKLVEKGKCSARDAEHTVARIMATTALEEVSVVDYVIEAVIEELGAKQELLSRLDAICGRGVILASNTSSISITLLAAATSRPTQVLGMHFMNPAPLMPLVELIRGEATTDATIQIAADLCARLRKTSVEVRDYPGFIANRILLPMINEAMFAVMEGVGTPAAVDTVAKLALNHPMGPLQLADLIGLDVCLAILNVLQNGFGDPKYRPCPLLRRMVAAGHLGRKSGRGFYTYEQPALRARESQ